MGEGGWGYPIVLVGSWVYTNISFAVRTQPQPGVPEADSSRLNRMGYRLTYKAEEDIIDIFRAGVGQFGLYQAERYHEQLERCFRFLADNPLAAHARFEIVRPIRIQSIGSHLIVYRVDDGDVFIIRVRHRHHDLPAYKAERDRVRQQALDALTEQAQDLNMGY